MGIIKEEKLACDICPPGQRKGDCTRWRNRQENEIKADGDLEVESAFIIYASRKSELRRKRGRGTERRGTGGIKAVRGRQVE